MEQRYSDILNETEGAKYLLHKYCKTDVNIEFLYEKSIGDDYRTEVCNGTIKVFGETPVAFNAAVGKILRSDLSELDGFKCHFENEIRGTYFANHFYNYYHAAPVEEVCEYLESLALWGQSVIQLWFDMHHFQSLNDAKAKEMIHKMKVIFKKAKSLGMKTALLRVANEYYDIGENDCLAQNSLDNKLYKAKLCGYFYTELCPSKEAGREMLINSVSELLSEFSDIGLDYFSLWPYDQGGCTCEDCYPWGGNGYYKLSKELAFVAKKMFPDIKIIASAWFFDMFTDGEWNAFIDACEKDGIWFDYIMVDICREIPTRVNEFNAPLLSFPEVSMQGATPWGGFGANPLPEALKKQFDKSGKFCEGGVIYSEGIFDDINKIISLELFRNPNLNVDDILREYCLFYFGEKYAEDLTRLIKMLEITLHRGRYEADGKRNDYPSGEQIPIAEIRFNNPEIIETVKNMFYDFDKQLPDEIKKNWRYKILWIRAFGDYELFKNSGFANEQTDEIYGQLTRIYHGEKAHSFLAPYIRKNIIENRGHI